MPRYSLTAFVVLLIAQTVPAARAAAADEPPDAVYEVWFQSWHVAADGTVVYHHRSQVRLNNDRAYGAFADPRIAYDQANDAVRVIVARVQRPNGTTLEVPTYSRNEVSPQSVAGWPAFASRRERVLTMSGIEPGCVVELEYETRTRPGHGLPSRDLRLDDHYPIVHRTVQLSWDEGRGPAILLNRAGGSGGRKANGRVTETRGERQYRVELRDAAPAPDEPLAPPWRERCPRLTFSWSSDVADWLSAKFNGASDGDATSESVKAAATNWTAGKTRPSDRLRALQEKLAATFNFIDPSESVGRLPVRSAVDVLGSNYGTPQEAQSLLQALARAANVSVVTPAVVVHKDYWLDNAPADTGVEAYVVCLHGGGKSAERGEDADGTTPDVPMQFWHAQHGMLTDPMRWGSQIVLMQEGKSVRRLPIVPAGAAGAGRIDWDGRIVIAGDAGFSGTVHIRLGGAFVAAGSLRTADQQRGRVETLVRRVLPTANIGKVNVSGLTPTEFAASVELSASPPLPVVEGAWRLQLGREGPAEAECGLPLYSAARRLPIKLSATIHENVQLTVEWPKEWKAIARPVDYRKDSADWGEWKQTVETTTSGFALKRTFIVGQRDIPVAAYTPLRDALSVARSDTARTLLLIKTP